MRYGEIPGAGKTTDCKLAGKQRAMCGGEKERATRHGDTWSEQQTGLQISLANKERCAGERMSERATRHGEIPGAGKTPDSKIAGKQREKQGGGKE